MKNFQDKLKRASEHTYSHFEQIDAGDYKLSIQGNFGIYSTPRKNVKPYAYSSMEIAIFKGNKWLCVTRSSVFRNFKRYNELMERADGHFRNGSNSGSVVFGYVPVDLINDLYNYLIDIS